MLPSITSTSTRRRVTVSNEHNEEILVRLYDEAYEELRPQYIFQEEYVLHYAAVDLAKKRMEEYHD